MHAEGIKTVIELIQIISVQGTLWIFCKSFLTFAQIKGQRTTRINSKTSLVCWEWINDITNSCQLPVVGIDHSIHPNLFGRPMVLSPQWVMVPPTHKLPEALVDPWSVNCLKSIVIPRIDVC